MQNGIPFPDWLSPNIVSFSAFGMEFALRWYAMAYIVGILVGWRIVLAAAKRATLWRDNTSPMTPEQIENLLTWIVLGVILGGRLGYVLFYKPGYYLAHPLEIPAVWQGGMAFHGGFLGVVVAITLFCRRNNVRLSAVADSVALAVPVGLLLGRTANFINAELWGRQTDMPWGVIFPGTAAQDCGTLVTLCARHPSQLYEAFLEGLVLLIVLSWLAFRRGALKMPWLISGVFFAGYGLGRFVVEFVRQPDAQFVSDGNPLGLAWQVGGYGLTMGQMLSLPMIIVGVAVVIAARRRA